MHCRGGSAGSRCKSRLWRSPSTRRERRSGRRCGTRWTCCRPGCFCYASCGSMCLLPCLLWCCCACWCWWHTALRWRPPCAPAPLAPDLAWIPVCLTAVQPRANHVWMAGVGSAADEAEVLRCCREGAIPPPEHLLKVGCNPGVLGKAEWSY